MDWVIVGLGVGVGVGVVYFLGLRITVERMVGSGHPAWLAVGSLVVRVLVAGAAFGFVVRGGAVALVAALAGFIGVRTLAVRRWGAVGDPGEIGMEDERATHA